MRNSFSKILSCAEKLLSVAIVLLYMHCAYIEYYHCKFHFTVAAGGDSSFVQCVLGEHSYSSLLLLFQCYQFVLYFLELIALHDHQPDTDRMVWKKNA